MHVARHKGYDKVVEAFQCHGIEVNVPNEVSGISFIYVKLYYYWHVHVPNIINIFFITKIDEPILWYINTAFVTHLRLIKLLLLQSKVIIQK